MKLGVVSFSLTAIILAGLTSQAGIEKNLDNSFEQIKLSGVTALSWSSGEESLYFSSEDDSEHRRHGASIRRDITVECGAHENCEIYLSLMICDECGHITWTSITHVPKRPKKTPV
ncbi:MAG: hypothetical protein HY606_05280 [Planctomycetes bacterium]|nr:hypothetical protein [Planctomycetota bacterium]